MSSRPNYPDDPAWDDLRTAADQWCDDWAERARRHPAAASQGFVLTPARCYDLGLTRAQLRSRVRQRIWWAPRPGVLSVIHPGDDAEVAATLRATAAALTIGHRSSATKAPRCSTACRCCTARLC